MMSSRCASSQASASCAVRAVVLARDRREAVEQLQIAREVLALEARHGEADVLGRQRRDIAHAAGEKAARDRAEGDEGDAQLPAGVEHGDLGVARPERIFGLEGGDRMDRVGLAQRGGGDFGDADAS